MKTVEEVMQALESLGSEQTRKVLARHGAPTDRMFGVKIGDLKPIQKKFRGNQDLAMGLYATGNSDAMYLAGLIADGARMTKKQLESWAREAFWYMISEHTVPGVAAESPFGRELANKWINARKQTLHPTGWSTWSLIVATYPDEDLDMEELRNLIQRVEKDIHDSPDRCRYSMNSFLISVGGYVKPLLKESKAAARRIGTVEVNMGETACKVPVATDYIEKMEKRGIIGKKRTSTKC
ncbi:MAG: DNA alkylation repair protein [Planctomycetaceae bacterium]